jgi:hypothetical protein
MFELVSLKAHMPDEIKIEMIIVAGIPEKPP